MDFTDVALTYVHAGLCTLPAILPQKQPVVSWKVYQERLPCDAEVAGWFGNAQAVCLVTGQVSGNLELLDFDVGGELYPAWRERVIAADPDLLDRLVVEQSFSQGRHVVYRCESPICGNLKLARRRQPVSGPELVTICGKRYVPYRDADGQWYVLLTLIETRGEGGIFLCAPSPGYTLQQGQFTDLPVLTEAQRELLLETAWSLNELPPEPETLPVSVSAGVDGRPGDDFNQRGDVRAVLRRHGWSLAKSGDNEYWRRPGKSSGNSATLKDGVFYVFSSNAPPFESEKAYAPFAVYALLEHSGDYAAAASTLRMLGFGGDPTIPTDVNISHLIPAADDKPKSTSPRLADPGPIPEELFNVPGYVRDVMDFSLFGARYPSVPLAFCGAMALQSFLCSRKVRDRGGLRPNVYMLALAGSGTGKAYPRTVNAYILGKIGMGRAVGNQIASGQGLEGEMLLHRKMLYQTDEVDHLLRSLASSKESYHSALLAMLLQLYSEADQVHAVRSKAKSKGHVREFQGEIDQPGLVVFGTATPECFYEALSPRLLTNGLFSRSIVVDVGERGHRQPSHDVSEMPRSLLEVAKWWKEYNPAPVHPTTGEKPNLNDEHPMPAIVPYTDDGYAVLDAFSSQADEDYDAAIAGGDRVRAILATRASENATRLALVYACSRDRQAPCIDAEVAEWATRFTGHMLRRMLFMARQHVAENPFHAECLKVLRLLREAGGQMPRRELMRLMHCKAADFDQIVGTLVQQEDVVAVNIITRTKPVQEYRLA